MASAQADFTPAWTITCYHVVHTHKAFKVTGWKGCYSICDHCMQYDSHAGDAYRRMINKFRKYKAPNPHRHFHSHQVPTPQALVGPWLEQGQEPAQRHSADVAQRSNEGSPAFLS